MCQCHSGDNRTQKNTTKSHLLLPNKKGHFELFILRRSGDATGVRPRRLARRSSDRRMQAIISKERLSQTASGVENPATSLTRSAWRATPVFAYKRLRWVLTVVTATPRAAATSGTPPISTMASSTRSSVGVSLYISPITSGGDEAARAALRTNNAAAAL